MPVRDIYLKIEEILDYSPVEPEPKVAPPKQYRRDCMRNPGHEDTTIPLAEVKARTLTALVYREYVDSGYLIPKPDKLVLADINEPVFSHRVPGTVIYARPGERLRIHVLNADVMPHSFHVHGLIYGIDSDGSWPFGTQNAENRRSDEICPGQRWTYTYDVTDQTIGAWPFHDHYRMIGDSINRGLFGGIIVLPEDDCEFPRPFVMPRLIAEFLEQLMQTQEPVSPAPMSPMPHAGHSGGGLMPMPGAGGMAMPGGGGMPAGSHLPEPAVDFEVEARRSFLDEYAQVSSAHPLPDDDDVLHVPIFFHFMNRTRGTPAFDINPFPPGAAPVEVTFGAEGTFTYHCQIHPNMQGKVTVVAGEAPLRDVNIVDTAAPFGFDPPEVKVRPGGKVRFHPGTQLHTVTEDGAGLPSYCMNGRSFVGNTPTILARAGQRIRFYVFNLDLSMMWHNFHTHAMRFRFAQETIDTRSIGPAESFMLETTAPPVLLLPYNIEKAQHPDHRPKDAKEYKLRGDFLFHCHVEMHMMQGLAGLVRSQQTVWLTPDQVKETKAQTGLPIDDGQNMCPDVDLTRCETNSCGKWEEVPNLPEVTFMHAAPIPNTNRVLFWGYGDTRLDVSRIWDYSTPAGAYSLPSNQPQDVSPTPGVLGINNPANIWSSEHAFLDNAEGTLLAHGGFTPRESYLFHPATLRWSRSGATAQDRFYSTTLTLADGKVLTLFGSASRSIEVYDPVAGSWSSPKPLPATFNYIYYPWTYLLPGGDLFIAGHQGVTRRFNPAATPIVDDPAKTWMTIAGERSTVSERGTSVLLPLRPPGYAARVLIAGGDPPAARQTSEMIDLSVATPAWTALPNLNVPRPEQVNAVLLPDGRVFLAGGIDGTGGPAEIFDPANPGAGWLLCSSMKYPRGYHSAAVLLADGSVLMGGDRPGAWKSGENTPHERYFPSYFSAPRPTITGAPATTAHGAVFTVQTPSPGAIAEVVLLRPGAVTHGFNMSQRFIGCVITARGATSIDVQAPPDGTVAPPGYYLLFMVDSGRIPSVARWIRVTP